MKSPSFDVLREPWIPVIRRAGGPAEELGILPCLGHAHEILEIRDPTPIVEFGLYRLLVAFVLDSLIEAGRRPGDPDELADLLSDGRFDMALIDSYVSLCGNVFDLFHPEKPFLQTAMTVGKKKTSIASIYPLPPSGTNPLHWFHQYERDLSVSMPEATRLLTTIAPFMTQGGQGKSPSINGAPGLYALPIGRNLFETILINIPLRNNDSGNGRIAWRNARIPGSVRNQATMVEALTWRPRKVRLIPEEHPDGTRVRWMGFEKGDKAEMEWIDPNLAYRYKDDKVSPVRMQEGRPVWRDAGALLINQSEYRKGTGKHQVAFKRPYVLDTAYGLIAPGGSQRVAVYGMRSEKVKVLEWAKSVFTVPAGLGRATRLGGIFHRELDRAEDAANLLHCSITWLYPREGAGNKQALATLSSRCERAYWQKLEKSFQPLMDSFAALGEDAADDKALIDEATADWRREIGLLAQQQFETAAKDMDADGDAIERQVKARRKMNAYLRRVLDGD